MRTVKSAAIALAVAGLAVLAGTGPALSPTAAKAGWVEEHARCFNRCMATRGRVVWRLKYCQRRCD
jgi:hypothetical protein